MIVYYISGPMAGYPEKNFPAFQHAKDTLTAQGYQVVSPHEVDETDCTEWADFLRKDLVAMLNECSGIVLLDGWAKSRGARLELDIALSLGWPVLYFDGTRVHDMAGAL